ncbi:MAG: hypothetical protein TREMPRED_003149 [Tremellales sp. Tagirdzhanova-0007]|nr:MAG: hypothetical protein TREMPRED_003149 [Tremellales sp. Tagirdzhanova-0007]
MLTADKVREREEKRLEKARKRPTTADADEAVEEDEDNEDDEDNNDEDNNDEEDDEDDTSNPNNEVQEDRADEMMFRDDWNYEIELYLREADMVPAQSYCGSDSDAEE